MKQDQTVEPIPVEALLEKVRTLRESGHRLVQIAANRFVEHVEITYSFGLNLQLTSLRVTLPSTAPRLPSISSVYACSVLYENEIHDLFNISVEGMAVDFHGHLYETTVKFPFGSVKPPVAKPAPAAAPVKPAATAAPAAPAK